jgi:post-segregation antitoxin (ccd killing protein)
MILENAVARIIVTHMTTLNLEVDERVADFAIQRAKELGITVSQLFQLKLSAEIPFADSKRETVKCELTGIPMFKSSPNDIPLNNETVREMLSDFP